ncbi:hypothetical protein [Microbacterium sp. A93]|uniref:hypothetical protein n=1 Tax=unclassified Microbacterium TaxID=2609290 RepID=UPI003F41DBC3
MRHLQSLVLLSVTTVLLAGCATAVSGAESSGEPSAVPSASDFDPALDTAAAAKADSWLEGAVLPAAAVRVEESGQATLPSFYSYQGWPCSPMEIRTGYWTVEGADLVETANWLKEHPTADLIVTVPTLIAEGTQTDAVTLGNASDFDSLEGIAYSVVRTDHGVAIRAEIGVFTETTVCPSLPPGHSYGGPGQG